MAEMAYAALVSLMHVLEQVLHPARHWIFVDREQIKALHEKVCFFQKFLEDYSLQSSKLETDRLKSRMLSASYAAEDIIESFVLGQIVTPSPAQVEKSFRSFSQEIQKVTEEMNSIQKKVLEIKEKMGIMKDQQFINSLPAGSSRLPPGGDKTMVGFDNALVEIMYKLTGHESQLQMTSIVGMGGIGKTTLARNIYHNPLIVQHFDICSWVAISQEYTVREVLLAILCDIENFLGNKKQERGENLAAFTDKMSEKSDAKLGEQLYERLFGRRYLIVMDDVRSTKVWDEVKRFFPDNSNESRIMVTTRLSDVARCLDSREPYEMAFLDEEKSWDLLCEKVYLSKGCPPELEKIGKRIAKSCGGLPLALAVIGGLLAKSEKTQELWEYVAENLKSIINSGDNDQCLKILSLSYTHLPIHLKPCFLYMATFPEDHVVPVSKLINLWVAEGFLKPMKGKSLEEVAEEYLKELVDRNLIIVGKQGSRGKMKNCIIHDLLRDLCLREAQKENVVYIKKVYEVDTPPGIEKTRCLCIHQSTKDRKYSPHVLNTLRSASNARSVMCGFKWISPWLTPCLKLLRILDVRDRYSPEEIMHLVSSRYLALDAIDSDTHYDWRSATRLTSSISLLWNLQTLIVHGHYRTILPPEIWKMTQLRHLKFRSLILPDPPQSHIAIQNSDILENLQTISTVSNLRCTKEVFERIPNVKKMKIAYGNLPEDLEWSYYSLNNLDCLHRLESLSCWISRDHKISAGDIALPCSLQKLTLGGCRLPWKDMTIVGSLLNLEVLKLEDEAFMGPEWNAVKGEFVRLKFLLIHTNDLKYWRADNPCFPSLEHLILNRARLEEYPSRVAELAVLRVIQLTYCNDSAVSWGKQLLLECENLGYDGLQIRVRHFHGTETYLVLE